MVPSLNLKPSVAFTAIAAISAVLTFMSWLMEHAAPLFHHKRPNAKVLAVRFVHYIVVIFSTTYIFVFDRSFDVFYVVFVFLMFAHWQLFNNECILNAVETSHYIEDYLFGSNPELNLYMRAIFRDLTKTVMIFCGIMVVSSIMYVLYRSTFIPTPTRIMIAVLYIAYVVYVKKNNQTTMEGFVVLPI